ncbi:MULTISPECIES: Fe-S cluster assembly protein SufD [Trichocoleus]|uniref:Fe-S cluster assembly protein SufD n=1 Tax=Trichocoleus desertorum GB2-A4 TaxID=2933944 RepID=A0ABV0J6P6_9CYAN|nr:Fe-S cluster assembly protein SufD [Trichocoleus sp. FACHB-46]MBD1862069.1 Fe-S cluster assembly protein SufD [Trichocoleus sp. FACHB-46]
MTIQVSPEQTASSQAATNREAYLAGLLKLAQSTEVKVSDRLPELRSQAAALVQEQTFPTTRNEEWRYTDLSPLLQVELVVGDRSLVVSSKAVQAFALLEAAESRLVFVNGVYTSELSAIANLPANIFVGNLAALPEELKARSQNYLAKQPGAEEVFTALNTAGLSDAAIVWIPKNQEVETPIHLLFVSTASDRPILSQPRCLVVAETGSSVTLVEDYGTVGEGVYFTNSVTEIWVEQNAQVRHTRVQRDSQNAFHIGKTAVSQARDSRYTCNAVSFGAKLSRHNLEIFQTGEQTETNLNGLTLVAGDQLGDTHSTIAYTQPHGSSRQLHKTIVDGQARAVFNGKVFVPKLAQLTDAGQLNRNLLLSPKARVDTKPQLEITADNVKCSHGATVGQIDPDEIFYLQSRGLDQASARQLLVYAFAIEIIDQIPVASVRDRLSQLVKQRAF